MASPGSVRQPSLLVLAMTGVIATLPVSPPAAQAKHSGSEKQQWPAKYIDGRQRSKTGAKVTLSINRQAIVCKRGKDVLLEIPAAGLIEVGYDTEIHSKGWVWLQSGSQAGSGGGYSGVVAAPFLFGAAVAAPFKAKRHFVRILWNQNETPKEELFEVRKDHYPQILAELQRVSGKPWQNLPEARKKLADELEQAKDRKSPLQLDRTVLVNEAELKPGVYQIVLLERAKNRGEIYFFSGQEVNPQRVVAQAVVKIETSTGQAAPQGATYGVQHGVATVSEIWMSDKTLHLLSSPVPAQVELAARSSYARKGLWAVISWVEYNSEPALRFRVVRNQFSPGFALGVIPVEVPRVCEGLLYVTHTRIAYERAVSSDPHCETFSAMRNQVKVQPLVGKWAYKVTVGAKSQTFRALLERGSGSRQSAGLWKTSESAREYSAFFVRVVADFDAVQREFQMPTPPSPQP